MHIIPSSKKEPVNLKDSKEGYTRGIGGRKRKGQINNIFKKKNFLLKKALFLFVFCTGVLSAFVSAYHVRSVLVGTRGALNPGE